MLITFQIILILIILLFGLGAISEKDKDRNIQNVSVLIASLLAMCFTLWVG